MDYFSYKDVENFFCYGNSGPQDEVAFNRFIASFECPYCRTVLELWKSRYADPVDDDFKYEHNPFDNSDIFSQIKICPKCGWWHILVTDWGDYSLDSNIAILKKFDIGANETPLIEIRKALSRNWNQSRFISAQRAEDLVASVFKEHYDCDVVYFSNGVYSPDHGIDFALITRDTGKQIAVQVKRRQSGKPECVSEVRAFIGAVALSNFENAIFVTTAEHYTRDVLSALLTNKQNLQQRKIDLTLIDGQHLRELCKLDSVEKQTIDQMKILARLEENWWLRYDGKLAEMPTQGGINIHEVFQRTGIIR